MDLFNSEPASNLLPYDGTVNYFGKVLKQTESHQFLETFLETIAWKNDEVIIYGKRIVTKRMAAWYGDKAFVYEYSGTTKQALPWTEELLALKKITEEITSATYNSCLLNLYHNGEEGLSWHSDDEKWLQRDGAIASFSFGAERRFLFKHKKTKVTIEVLLESGSLLVMRGPTQRHWLHSLPKTKKVTRPRINLTFRTIAI